MSELTNVTIYTDGACSGNPVPGRWGCILIAGKVEKEMSGGAELTTNNRMELMAVIKGLSALTRPCKVTLYSDSAYVVNAFAQHWLDNWIRNGWVNSAKAEVANKDLWQELLKLNDIHEIEFVKVKGHADNEYNNRCDALAVAAAAKYK